MEITRDTLTAAVLPYISQEDFDKLYEKIDEIPLKQSLFSMTCGEYIQACDDFWVKCNILSEEYLVEAIGRLKAYRREQEQIQQFLKLNEIELSTEENNAKRGVTFPTFYEDILLTVAEFFHLPSLDAAEKVPFSNYLIVQKKKSADAKYERQLHKQYEIKSKQKSKR